jgi:hypothetical protein
MIGRKIFRPYGRPYMIGRKIFRPYGGTLKPIGKHLKNVFEMFTCRGGIFSALTSMKSALTSMKSV